MVLPSYEALKVLLRLASSASVTLIRIFKESLSSSKVKVSMRLVRQPLVSS